MAIDQVLTPAEFTFLAAARRAVLATIDDRGSPRLVPICFAVMPARPPLLYTPVDEKPKRVADPHDLGRIRDIVQRPGVTLLIDRWSEDWTRLGWLRLKGMADLVEPGDGDAGVERATAVAALRHKYPQYATHRLEDRPMIRIRIERSRSWGSLDSGEAGPG
jgi:PPOX class probable F420-dependent enzyme